MKIEAGKFYRCRDGSKARVYATDGGGIYPIHGAHFVGEWKAALWTKDGRFSHDRYNYVADLVSEWPDIEPTEAQVDAALQKFREDPFGLGIDRDFARKLAHAVLNAPSESSS